MTLTLDNMKPLLELLERINPCNQEYESIDGASIISYSLKLNIFNFTKLFPIHIGVKIIGLPISLCEKGYWGNSNAVRNLINSKSGLKVVLNAERDLGTSGQTLSTFVFYNNFSDFNDYLNSLRSSYRRRIKQALSHRKKLLIKKIDKKDFTEIHYKSYLSIMERTENPLEILPIEFFKDYDCELHEFLELESGKVLGFSREDKEEYDLYYNMLIKIIEIGIKKGIKTINFGQTAEESKLKIGCLEVPKYLYIHHSNYLINKILEILAPLFSYKPYKTVHNVFKLKEIDL